MSGRRKAGRGALFIVAMLFATSGALRLGSGIGTAMANAEADPEEPVATEPAVCESPVALSDALKQREERLAVREASLQDRLAALALADQAVTDRMVQLEKMEAKIAEKLEMDDGAAEADVESLTKVYQAMKPKDAAKLFETMSPEFAAGFLGRMPPESAAAILSGMSAEAAYGVSVIVAGRNANVPKD